MSQPISKSQKRLLAILGLVATYAAYDLLSPKKETVEKQKSKSAVVAEISKPVAQPAAVGAQIISTFDQWKRDPFTGMLENTRNINLEKLFDSALPRMTNFELSAISRNGKQAFAIINDQVVGIGESINGFKVIEIQSNRVMLRKNDYSFTIALPDDGLDL